MMITRIVTWRAQKAYMGLAAKSYDARAAFHSGNHEALKAITRRRALRKETTDRTLQNADLLDQRRDGAIMLIDTAEGPLYLRAGTGGLMGDSNEPEIFMQGHYDMLQLWLAQTKNLSHPLTATSPIDGANHDGSLGF